LRLGELELELLRVDALGLRDEDPSSNQLKVALELLVCVPNLSRSAVTFSSLASSSSILRRRALSSPLVAAVSTIATFLVVHEIRVVETKRA
jgi:hypothetical protein